MSIPIVEFKNVSFSYGKNKVLHDINLKINRGEFVAVLGYNGSGKSTLAKHMNAILLPEEGEVLVDGILTSDESRLFDIRSRVGMVFQNPDNQIVSSIVEEDVAFAPENMGMPADEMRRTVDEALAAVGMSDYRRAVPSKLSGGQKQRVAIAGVLAMRPQCIVLDEATAMLDPSGRARMLGIISQLKTGFNMSVVLITHYMEEAAQADRVIVLDGGRIARDAPPKQVFSDAKGLRDMGLDVPAVTEFCALLRAQGFNVPQDVISVEECADVLVRLMEDKNARN